LEYILLCFSASIESKTKVSVNKKKLLMSVSMVWLFVALFVLEQSA